MAFITDPREIEAFMQGVEEVDYSTPSPQMEAQSQEPQGQSWGLYNSDEGSILETAKQRMGAQYEALIAANVENPDMSRYAQNRFVNQYKDWQEESAKLGMVGNVAAGAVGYAPSIVPIAGDVFAGVQSTGDALIAQHEQGRPFDMGSATTAGIQSAATNRMLGGMGKMVPKPGSGFMGQAKAIGAQTLAEDVTSNAASQIYENLAAGKDWNQDVGTAAVVGGVAGAGMRGGFAGVSKALEIPFNKGGEKAITRATDIERKSGEEINPEFANSFVDIENAKAGVRAKIDDIADVDSPDLDRAITEYNTLSERGAVESAMAELGEIVPDLHMTLQGYNINMRDLNGRDVNLGRDVLNLSEEAMQSSKIRISDTRNRAFEGEGDAAKAGLTQEAFNFKLAESYNKKFSEGNGNLQENLHYVKERMRTMKAQEAPRQVQSLYNDLNIYMKEYAEAINKRLKTPSKSAEMTEVVRDIGSKINSLAIKLGEDANLKSFRGEKGNFDATRDYMVVSGLHDSAVAQNPKYVFGVADPLKVAKDSTTIDSLANAALSVGTVGVLPAVKGLTNWVRRGKVRKELAEAKTLGQTLRRPKQRMEEQLAAGNAPAAKDAAIDALKDEGISVPLAPKTEAPVVETPVVRESVAEPIVEAPVTPVEPFVPTPSVDAKAKVQPAPKAVQEVVEEAPAPAPKPKAKSRTEPAKKKKKLDKSAVEKATAEIAAALQAKILAGEAPHQVAVEAKAAIAPKAKEVAEAPVEAAPVVEAAPAPKAQAKAAKAPKAKEKAVEAEPVVETKVEPEAPKEPTIPKGRRAPKEKEVEPEVKDVQEAPSKAVQEPLGRKQPTRTEKEAEAPESVTEAPVETKVEEPAAPKEKPYAQRVREPLQKILDEKVSRKDAAKFNDAVLRREQAKQDLKDIKRMEGMHKDFTPEDVARVIHEVGGMEKLRAAAKEDGVTADQYFKARLLDMEGLRKREAAKKASELKELLTTKAAPAKPKAETVDTTSRNKQEFDGEMQARGYHADDVQVAEKAIEDGMSLKNARILAQRLNAERKDTMKAELKETAEVLKEANAVLKNEGKKAQVDAYLKGLDVEGDKEIADMVNSVFKHRGDEVKPKEMQNLLNKIDRYLDDQLNEYNSLIRGGGKADPRHPEWTAKAAALRSSQSDLKRNRAQVDREYTQARQNASEASTEHAQMVKEYDKLFDQANTRDANANKVMKQKDELTTELENKGFEADDIAEFVGKTFYKRETTPMNEREMQRTINNFVEEKARARKKEVEAKKKAVKHELTQVDTATLAEMGETIADNVEYSTKLDSADDELAMISVISEELSRRGDDPKLSKRFAAFAEGLEDGKERKAKYPNNPELWIPANLLQDIQKSFGTGTSSYAGRMGVALKLALTGDKEGAKGFGTLDKQIIASRAKKLEAAEEGKFLTGMDDLIIK